MEIILIGLVAFFASILTFFSGFGLGSLLLPAFAIFFPIEIAVGATAVVHFTNNLVKGGLIGKYGNWSVLRKFGIMAFLFSFLGSYCLLLFSGFEPLFTYQAGGKQFTVLPHKIIIGTLMFLFVLFENLGSKLESKFLSNLYLGGAISGFFGGFSGHQGALRSLFLLRLGMSKEQFIATGIWIAIVVDLARLSIYRSFLGNVDPEDSIILALVVGIIAAVIGAVIGRRLLKKVSLSFVNHFVAGAILLISLLLILGIV